MKILDPTSLMKTLDNINERYLFSTTIPEPEGIEVAQWITAQQGKKGHYRNMYAPSAMDFEQGMRLFTGERLVSASARHIMGQEAARATWLLGKGDPEVREVYGRATGWMAKEPGFQESGTFCCGRCSLAYWRHMRVGSFKNKETYISKGLLAMKDCRDQKGAWHRFPFFYAIYTLLDLDLEAAFEELIYARPRMEKFMRNNRPGLYSKRRVTIIEKALQKLN
jgi:hypothetical protein